VVKEEVRVGKRKVRETRTVEGDVRKEEVTVENTGRAKVRHTNKGKK
jgi:stress response protein YsnF